MCLRVIFSLIPLTAFLMALKSITFYKNRSFVAALKKKLLYSAQELQLLQSDQGFHVVQNSNYPVNITNMPARAYKKEYM